VGTIIEVLFWVGGTPTEFQYRNLIFYIFFMITMGRKAQGGTKKTIVSILMHPNIWDEFKKLVASKHQDGDKTASAHMETLAKREVDRLKGGDVPDPVDVDALRRKLADVKKQGNGMLKELRKRPGVC
jgi:hypothetical protein